MNASTLIDFYKADHRRQYPDDTTLVFSNFTPRSSRLPHIDSVVLWGLQYYVTHYLDNLWQTSFFQRPKQEVLDHYKKLMEHAGFFFDLDHMAALHDYGRLPINVLALPEGSRCPLKVPMLVMWNSQADFGWLTNYLESNISNVLWKPCTAATIADSYRVMLDHYMQWTGGPAEFVDFQAHDFSYRGLSGTEDSYLVGSGHLLSFTGTDSVPALEFVGEYYNAFEDGSLVGGSVPATEHSVMCMGTKVTEIETFERLITEVYPEGVVSIVSDTWDYWKVLTEYLPKLKDKIMARNGKVVIRPDSGDPVKVICGDPDATPGTPQHKGTFRVLWELFGGTSVGAGYSVLDDHIGVIYGDSITYERANEICHRLTKAFFVPTVVFGVGSYTYQYVTRDTFGFAMKATYGVVGGEEREIFKDPVTDDGTKRSARGLLAVHEAPELGRFVLEEQATWDRVMNCAFEARMIDGRVYRPNIVDLATVRERLKRTRA